MTKMLGKTNQPFCGSKCCGDTTKKHKRTTKRSERAAWKKADARERFTPVSTQHYYN